MLKNIFIIAGVEAAILLLRFVFTLLLSFFSDKLENKSDVSSGKTSGLFLSLSLLSGFFVNILTSVIPLSIVLSICYRWEKVFAVAFFICVTLCLLAGFRFIYTGGIDMIESGYKHIFSFISIILLLQYFSDFAFDFAAFYLMDAFSFGDHIRAIIHLSIVTVVGLINIIYIVLYCRKKV